MKRVLFAMLLMMPAVCGAQEFTNKAPVTSLDGRSITITITDSASKTIWFSLPPSGVLPARPEVDTTSAVNPPNRVAWDGNGSVMIRLKSGNTSDSTRLLIQGLDEAGTLIDNDDHYLVASASTFADAGFDDNNTKIFSITGLFDAPVFGFKVTFLQADLTGGARVYEVKMPIQ